MARSCSTQSEVFWCISLFGVPIKAAQLHNERWTNSNMSLIMCLFKCSILQNILSLVSASGKPSFTSQSFLQMFRPAELHLSKVLSSFHFRTESHYSTVCSCSQCVTTTIPSSVFYCSPLLRGSLSKLRTGSQGQTLTDEGDKLKTL